MPWNELRSHIRHLRAKDLARVERAFQLGNTVHHGQKRKSGEPYFTHPVAVAHMLSDLGADADTLIAALLHDTVEDTPLTLAEIDREFGGSVASLIDGVTKLNASDVATSPKLDEQIETLRKIFTLMQQDVRIMVIKLVDRLHNMQTVEFLPRERQEALARETIEVFVKIADKLCMQDLRDELEGLCLSVLEPEIYKKLLEIRTTNEQRGLGAIEQIRTGLRNTDRHLSSRIDLSFEPKTWEQVKSQMRGGGGIATGVSYISVAIVSEDIDTCYRILGALHQQWKREVLSFQDYINQPQQNGYRGIHTTIILQDGTRIRCKVRAREMQDYAREGVSTVCFKGNAELSDILPWTKRITPLASDTEGSSSDFWLSLKNDILGESIIIHGPDDSTVQLPNGATALDGALYLFHDEALKIESILMNGIEVPFGTALTNAASMTLKISEKHTFNNDWLRYVQTGFAAAMIRSALMKQSEDQKLAIGREMLQRTFTERKRGFIEEFQESTVQAQLQRLGYESLRDVFISIADGRLQPESVYAALFNKPASFKPTRTSGSLVRYTIKMDDVDMMERMNLVHRKCATSLRDIHYRRIADGSAIVSLQVHMSAQELTDLEKNLVLGGAEKLKILRSYRGTMILIFGVIVLWALNPVIAKWFLTNGMSPLSLVTIRFLTFFVYTTGFYTAWRIFSRRSKYTPVPRLMLLTTLPAAGLIGMSFFNYFALMQMAPSLHLTILRLNTLLLPIILSLRKGFRFHISWLYTLLFFVLIIVLAIRIPGAPPIGGVLLSMLALFSYMLYSLMSEHVLQQKQISLRYPLFVAHLGLLLGIAGFLLLPWLHEGEIMNDLTLAVILYIVVCVCVPHMFYSLLLRRTSFTSFTDIFLLEVPFAIGFEGLFLGLVLPAPLYGVIGFILALLLFSRWKQVSTQIL